MIFGKQNTILMGILYLVRSFHIHHLFNCKYGNLQQFCDFCWSWYASDLKYSFVLTYEHSAMICLLGTLPDTHNF